MEMSIPIVNLSDHFPFSCWNSRNSTTTTDWVIHVTTGIVGFVLATLGICLNTSLLLVICKTKGRTREINNLIANLALASILPTSLAAAYISGLDKIFQNLSICLLFSYLRNLGVGLISLSVLSINYERVRKLHPASGGDVSFKVNRLIGAIWILSFLSAIPSLFVTNFVHHTHPDGTIHSLCTKMPNTDYFGSVATLETLRAGIFHVAIPAYMIYDLCRVRETYAAHPNVCVSCEARRDRQCRFIRVNSITFFLLWIPFGIGISIYKSTTLESRHQRFLSHPELDCESLEKSTSFYILAALFYCYVLLLPITIFRNLSETLSSNCYNSGENVNNKGMDEDNVKDDNVCTENGCVSLREEKISSSKDDTSFELESLSSILQDPTKDLAETLV